MKKIYLLAIITVYCFFTASAQIKEGSTLLGGQISYANSKLGFLNPPQKINSAVFNVIAGKAIRDNNVLGVNISYSPAKNYSYMGSGYYKLKQHSYTAGVFYRKYNTLARDFYFFIEPAASYTFSKQTASDTAGTKIGEGKSHYITLTVTPGISYSITKKLQVELTVPAIVSAGYLNSKGDDIGFSSTQKTFFFNSNLNITDVVNLGVGFRFIF